MAVGDGASGRDSVTGTSAVRGEREATSGEKSDRRLIPIQTRFTERFLTLYRNDMVSRQAVDDLLSFAQELRETDADFKLIIADRLSRDSIRRTHLIFRANGDLELQFRAEVSGFNYHTHVGIVFPNRFFARAYSIPDKFVALIDDERKMELRIYQNGDISHKRMPPGFIEEA